MGTVSCITTTYNRPKQLARAIRSVDAQTFEDWEHIVVHDGPASDETKAVMELYKNPKRKFIELPKNHGNHTKPKNEGIKASTGEYICYIDDDNEYLPNFMETMMLEFSMSSFDVLYALERIVKDEDDLVGEQAISFPWDPQLLLNRSFIDTNVVMHTRKAVYAVGGWDETLPRFADWNLFVRMAKADMRFKQIPIFMTRYYNSVDNSASKHNVKTWVSPELGIRMFDPTWFEPSACYIYLPYLGGENRIEIKPSVAIYTITKDRLEYTKRMWESLQSSTTYKFTWYVYDNGSTDGTKEWLQEIERTKYGVKIVELSDKNKGITVASNACVEKIMEDKKDLICKVDNDVLFLTKGWLEDFVDLWKRNHKLYIGPYPEGLVDHPGGSWRIGNSTIGDEYVEVTEHLPGMCTFIWTKVHRTMHWQDKFLHGQQDVEASKEFIIQGYMPAVIPRHRVQHMDTTAGQREKFPEYFEKRKEEKQTTVEEVLSYEELQEEGSSANSHTIWGEKTKEKVRTYKKYFKGTVLDVGCNDGVAMIEMKRLKLKPTGVDLSPDKVARAVKAGLKAVVGLMEALPFKDKEFDAIFCSHTFEHAQDARKAASEMMRVATTLVITVPIEKNTQNTAHHNMIDSVETLLSFFKGAEVLEENKDIFEYTVVLRVWKS